jgi:hypothetical protein
MICSTQGRRKAIAQTFYKGSFGATQFWTLKIGFCLNNQELEVGSILVTKKPQVRVGITWGYLAL